MQKVQYAIVEHDGGWAYKVDEVFSETFPSHADAMAAAEIASRRHELPGPTEAIEFQDSAGRWHEQVASGVDRPHTEVLDASNGWHMVERHTTRSASSPKHGHVFGTIFAAGRNWIRDRILSSPGCSPLT